METKEINIEKLQKELDNIYSGSIENVARIFPEEKKVVVSFSLTVKDYGGGWSEKLTIDEAYRDLKVKPFVDEIMSRMKEISDKYGFRLEIDDEFYYIGD